jgi:putative FmdB family regulatory protein
VPIYEYECRKCGVFDYEQSIADRPLARCPACRSKVTKLISASAFHLKGGGWYADGYDRKSGSSTPPSDDSGTASGAADTSSSAAPATPPAAKAKSPAKKKGSGASRKT